MTAPIRRVVLDVLEPIQLDTLELAGVRMGLAGLFVAIINLLLPG